MLSFLRRRRPRMLPAVLALSAASVLGSTAGLILHGPTPVHTVGNYHTGTMRA